MMPMLLLLSRRSNILMLFMQFMHLAVRTHGIRGRPRTMSACVLASVISMTRMDPGSPGSETV